MSKTIELNDSELLLIRDILDSYNDCGPENEGWQSDELINLKHKF